MKNSSKPLAFAKYQGLGNDFLIVDLRQPIDGPSPEACDESGFFLARKLCDRRLGIGGDGVLSLGKAESSQAMATMRVLNADGSEAEMCGNGLRCVAKYLLETGADPRANEVIVDTGAGALLCQATRRGDVIDSVTVNMGRPRLLRGEIPMAGAADQQCLDSLYQVGQREIRISAVSMGNPHAISFVPESQRELLDLAKSLGPSMETHSDFPQRTNVEFAHIHSRTQIELVVWERGVGITQACGTGACATVVAACLAGHCDADTEVAVALPGGTLDIRVASDYSQVLMRGPAVHVFSGSVDLASL